MKKALIIIGIILFISKISLGQDVATARIIETGTKDYSRIVVVYETGEDEVIPLKSFNPLWPPSKIDQLLIDNQKVINGFISRMENSGYVLREISSSVDGPEQKFVVFKKTK